MSGLLSKRAWLGGVAMFAALGFAACSDDDGSGDTPTGGSTAGGSAGSPQAGGGGSPAASGSANGGTAGSGTAGKAGDTSTSGTSMGGQDMGLAGEGGVGLGGAAGAGGEPSEADLIRALYTGMSPLPAVPADPTNAFADSDAAASLGQKFFFDEKFSGAMVADNDLGSIGDVQKVSCKSCHSGAALDDERSSPDNISKGTGLHSRNAPSLINSSFYTWTNWGGRFAAQWELPLAVVESPVIMNGNRLALAHRIFDVYKSDYEAIFGALTPEIGTDATRFPAAGKPKPAPTAAVPNPPDGAWEGMTAADRTIINRVLVNYSKALAAYTRKLVSRKAPFDKWMGGDDSAFDASQLNGAKLFMAKGCGNCHCGPHFSDESFHDLGVPQTGPGVLASDDGRAKDLPGLLNSGMNINGAFSDKTDTNKLAGLSLPPPDSMKGQFRTPSLRGVTLSGPYMHSGQFASLSAVIDFYAVGGTLDTGTDELTPFAITPQEKADLIAFLGTLTGEAVPAALLEDTAAN